MSIFCFRLIWCWDLLPFLYFYIIVNRIGLGFGLLVGQNESFQDVTLGFGICKWHFLFLWHFYQLRRREKTADSFINNGKNHQMRALSVCSITGLFKSHFLKTRRWLMRSNPVEVNTVVCLCPAWTFKRLSPALSCWLWSVFLIHPGI